MSIASTARPGLRVTELARAVGVSADSVRYYERVGLLPAPPRTGAGYRSYDVTAIDRMKFIQGAQRLGLRLREIRDLLTVRDAGTCPCDSAQAVLQQHLSDIDAEITRLDSLRHEVAAMSERLHSPACPPPVPGIWCEPSTGR